MKPDPPRIAVSQRVIEITAYEETRDCLDQQWTVWLASLGLLCVPVPNRLVSVAEFLAAIRPSGILLSGGNNLAAPAYDDEPEGRVARDSFECRDRTESELIAFAERFALPLLACCRGMQMLHTYYGGHLSRLESGHFHVNRPHRVDILDETYVALAGSRLLEVNSFHDFGLSGNRLPGALLPFAVSPEDGVVEGFFHSALPFVGIMWHPERPNPSEAFDRALATQLFQPAPVDSRDASGPISNNQSKDPEQPIERNA